MRVSSSTTISDEELVTYNVKELNRVLKSKGAYDDNYDAYDDDYDAYDDDYDEDELVT